MRTQVEIRNARQILFITGTLLISQELAASIWFTAAAKADEKSTDEVLKRSREDVGDFQRRDGIGGFKAKTISPERQALKEEAKQSFRGAGLQALNDNQYRKAIDSLEPVLEAAPSDLECRKALSQAHLKYGDQVIDKDRQQAINHYERALAVDASNTEAKTRLSKVKNQH